MKAIKEQLRGTCVYNESREMGREIVDLYEKIGISNPYKFVGNSVGYYYGVDHNGVLSQNKDFCYFKTTISLPQLRDITQYEREIIAPDLTNGEKKNIENDLKNCPKSIFINSSNDSQFRVGDEVEVNGSKYNILAIFKDEAWVDNGSVNFITSISQISRPKDKIIEKVEEIMCVHGVKADMIKKHIIYFDDDVRKMLIEAINWGIEYKKS